MSPKLILGAMTLAIVLMINPGTALAGGPSIPSCDGQSGPEAHLVGNIGGINSGSFAFTFTAGGGAGGLDLLEFTEVWDTSDRSYIIICGLVPGQDYHVKKTITNNTPLDIWLTFDNELLDPTGQASDLNDKTAEDYVIILGGGFSHSNDGDGLSFAMGTQDATRTSTQYASVFADELGTVDFLNYFNGPMNPGETDSPMSFSIREITGVQTPFILTQAPNFVRDCVETNTCPVGGEFLGVDTTALLVAGAQMNAAWLIPLVLGIIGIGIVIAKKLKN